jgi:hypothetical protein
LSRGFPGSPGLSLFAVEDTSVQLVWHDAPPDGAVVAVGDTSVDVTGGGGPRSIVLDGLPAATRLEVQVDGRRVGAVRTLAPPPGARLGCFATVSDLHVGERGFGTLPRFRERPDVTMADAYPARCGRAAVAEAAAWGADRLIAKGDLTWSGRAAQWEVAGRVLASSPVPVHATLGNHDVVPRAANGRDVLERHGVDVLRGGPGVMDRPGLRIVIAHSAEQGHRAGGLHGDQQEAVLAAVADAPGAAFVTMHHHVDPLPFQSRYPRGIPRAEGQPFLRALAAANPATFLTFGHTHRHRRKLQAGMPATEVGSTKDHPGVWAGYVVHEGGIRQVVRRIAEPSCLAWTERTAGSVFGLWGPWAAGRLDWRCFSWTWPDR